MPYTITRPHSFIRLACLGFRPSVVIGFIIPSVLYTLYSLIISPLAVIPLLILLLSLIIRYSRWGLAKAEARSTDSEWDAFVNAGLAVRTDHAACADPAGWLASSLPALVESSRPAQWLESLQIPFQQPIPLTLATPEQARDFAARRAPPTLHEHGRPRQDTRAEIAINGTKHRRTNTRVRARREIGRRT